ncbi:MAG: SPOR domain-containing protein [Bacteroidaceae bacterium]|nr:SPOR domain-containing protein [Bacteroidaceae bacterium]
MKRLLIFTLSILLCTITMSAQNFTDHLQSKVQGQGTVTVHQDSLLDDMVNGKKQFVPEKKDDGKGGITIGGVLNGKKTKARGYRIQVYWGGSTRTDQTNAQRAGNKVSTIFPELQVYTSFESPNWRCRVGDFVTRQDANDYLNKLKEARLGQGAIIVKSEVYIHQ